MWIVGDTHLEMKIRDIFLLVLSIALLLTACSPVNDPSQQVSIFPSATTIAQGTPQPTATQHTPGDLVDYLVQSGDTLPVLAIRFGTTVDDILKTNPMIPQDVTTLPPGLPMQIPAYFLPLLGPSFQILPDSEVINGPSAVDFKLEDEVRRRAGYLSNLTNYVEGKSSASWEVIELVAQDYSLHPRLFLTLLEFQTGALTNPVADGESQRYPLGYENVFYQGLYRQLQWAAERLSDGFYGWRTGMLKEIYLVDGRLIRPDPWQNAATIALHNFFAGLYPLDELESIVGPDGFIKSYEALWGEPDLYEIDLIPANLSQPEMVLPFEPSHVWGFSAGPHYSWGTSLPYGALDFAPPAVRGGCATSEEWIASPVEGVITRSEDAKVILDLDGDGDERTGWVLFFFHVATKDRIQAGSQVVIGDLIGHPSCEGGRSTGTHFHLARRYNGEWIPAGGTLPFVLDGWVTRYGEEPYLGTMQKGSKIIEACACTSSENQIIYDFPNTP
jgi:LasA protease